MISIRFSAHFGSVFCVRKFYTEQMFVLVVIDILKRSWQSSNELQTLGIIWISIKSYRNTNTVHISFKWFPKMAMHW